MKVDNAEWILASASPRRKQLLRELGIAFRAETAEVEEWEATSGDPAKVVAHNAHLKADAVSRLYPQAHVIGSDTTVALDGRIFHKPADLDEARRMLRSLSGRTHQVYTGVCLIHRAGSYQSDFVESSEVTFRDLSDRDIDSYFQQVNPLDKAGAYGIQDHRDQIIATWKGSLSNVMGLPIERLAGIVGVVFPSS